MTGPPLCRRPTGTIEPLDNFVPAAADAPKWIGDGDVLSSGVQGLVTAGASSRDLVEGGKRLLKRLGQLSGHRLPPLLRRWSASGPSRAGMSAA